MNIFIRQILQTYHSLVSIPKNLSGEQPNSCYIIYRPESPRRGGCLVKVPPRCAPGVMCIHTNLQHTSRTVRTSYKNISLKAEHSSYLLAIADERSKPRPNLCICSKQQTTHKTHQVTHSIIWGLVLGVIQGQSHTKTRQVTFFHLDKTLRLRLCCVWSFRKVLDDDSRVRLTTMPRTLRAWEGFILHRCRRASVLRRPPTLSSSCRSPFLIKPLHTKIQQQLWANLPFPRKLSPQHGSGEGTRIVSRDRGGSQPNQPLWQWPTDEKLTHTVSPGCNQAAKNGNQHTQVAAPSSSNLSNSWFRSLFKSWRSCNSPSLKLSGTLATRRQRNQAPFLTCSRASATSTIGNSEGSSARKKGLKVTMFHWEKKQFPRAAQLKLTLHLSQKLPKFCLVWERSENINTETPHTCLQNAENICCLLQVHRTLKELRRFEEKLAIWFWHLKNNIYHQWIGVIKQFV